MYGSFYSVLDIGETKYRLFSVWTDSQAEIQFGTLRRRRQFESDASRLELLHRLNGIPSVQIEEGRITGYPKIPFAALEPTGHIDQFLEAFEWVISVAESDINAPA